jgi:hypothetical protein
VALNRLGIKGWLTIAVFLALAGLLWWDHSFDSKGWVPSLGANLITMLVTVVVIDALFKQRQKRAAASMLRTSFIDAGCELGSVANTYVDGADPTPEMWWNRIIASWQRILDNLRRDLSYCATDLDHDVRQKVKDLEDRVKQYAEMGWSNFQNEDAITSKHVLETWSLVREIQGMLYPSDRNIVSIFDQVQESVDRMTTKYKPFW